MRHAEAGHSTPMKQARLLTNGRLPVLFLLTGLAMVASCAGPGQIGTAPASVVAGPLTNTVPGLRAEMLHAQYWQAKAGKPDTVRLDPAAVASWSARLDKDPASHVLDDLPAELSPEHVSRLVNKLSAIPDGELFDANGRLIGDDRRAFWRSSLQLERLPASQATRHGMVVRRADLRRFPSTERVFSRAGDTDIDRFQESALFPGTPVAIVHESADRQWWFVVSPRYAAWVEKSAIAEGEREAIRQYRSKTPFLIVSGAQIQTVFSNEAPELSQLILDMGLRLPLLGNWPADQPVNGQLPFGHHIVELPSRDQNGKLVFKPALLPATADVSTDYLPLTANTLLSQSFKFLGERYGWGHAYNARDCSGFVGEIYRSVGLELPRNTRDQGISRSLNPLLLDEQTGRQQRLELLRDLQVGDLLFIPGHVMMVIGFEHGEPWVIHDTHGVSLRGNTTASRLPLNGVVVTPLLPLLINEQTDYVDRLYSIQRLRP